MLSRRGTQNWEMENHMAFEKDAQDWLEAELADSLDEEYELELEDALLSQEIKKIYQKAHPEALQRPEYFRDLLRLQAELIRLQD